MGNTNFIQLSDKTDQILQGWVDPDNQTLDKVGLAQKKKQNGNLMHTPIVATKKNNICARLASNFTFKIYRQVHTIKAMLRFDSVLFCIVIRPKRAYSVGKLC